VWSLARPSVHLSRWAPHAHAPGAELLSADLSARCSAGSHGTAALHAPQATRSARLRARAHVIEPALRVARGAAAAPAALPAAAAAAPAAKAAAGGGAKAAAP